MPSKCKANLDHVDVVAVPSGGMPDGPEVWGVEIVEHGTCSNDRDYDGPLYVLTRLAHHHRQPKMKLMPDLAETLPARLREAAQMRECVQFKHKVLGMWVNVRRMKLTSDAALVLADTLDQATA